MCGRSGIDPIHIRGAIMNNPVRFVMPILRRAYGFDLDEDSGDGARLRFSPDNNGLSAFNALATFALAQGAALTAVARGEGRDALVLSIYAITVAITLWWIISMLRATRRDVSLGQQQNELIRAYDRPSIRYGRWTLTWTFVLVAILFVLGWLELLPNQTHRVAYDKGGIVCDTKTAQQRMQMAGADRATLDKWIEWIGRSSRVYSEEQCFWVKQKSPFEKSYKRFALDLHCDKRYVFGERVAFLVSNTPDDGRPTYRQLRFRGQGFSATNVATLDVEDANKGESIVILLFARDPASEKKQPTGAQFNFRLVPHFSPLNKARSKP